eukprot:1278171-Prymnesium_polylepis.1
MLTLGSWTRAWGRRRTSRTTRARTSGPKTTSTTRSRAPLATRATTYASTDRTAKATAMAGALPGPSALCPAAAAQFRACGPPPHTAGHRPAPVEPDVQTERHLRGQAVPDRPRSAAARQRRGGRVAKGVAPSTRDPNDSTNNSTISTRVV